MERMTVVKRAGSPLQILRSGIQDEIKPAVREAAANALRGLSDGYGKIRPDGFGAKQLLGGVLILAVVLVGAAGLGLGLTAFTHPQVLGLSKHAATILGGVGFGVAGFSGLTTLGFAGLEARHRQQRAAQQKADAAASVEAEEYSHEGVMNAYDEEAVE